MAKAYVHDMRYEKHFQSDVNRRALTAFKERGIPMAGEVVMPPAAPAGASAAQVN